LKKDPKERPTFSELLEKHEKFFNLACTPDYLVKHFLLSAAKLEERVLKYCNRNCIDKPFNNRGREEVHAGIK